MDAIVEVFNRYVEKGGEELIADKILAVLASGYEIESLRWDSREWKGDGAPSVLMQAAMMFYNRDSARRLREAIAARRPRAIIAHNLYPIPSPSIYFEAKRLGVPVIQFTHNFRPFSVNGTLWTGNRVAEESLRGNFWTEIRAGAWQESVAKSAIMALVLKWQKWSGSLDAVKRWVAISDFMRLKFIEAGLPPERVVTLRHFWKPLPSVPPPVDGDYYLFLGRLVREKGIRPLLDCWRRLEGKLGARCPKLVIAGTGPLEAEVRAASEACPTVRYAGFVADGEKDSLMRGARALVAPSIWWEPLGLVTYEAYDYGKPMLAAASGGLCETVEDGRSGLLFEPGSAESFCDAVLRMEAADKHARIEMGRRGREWLVRENSEAKWLEGFNEIVASAAI